MEFRILIERDEDGWYVVTVPALPGCVSQGRTEEEARWNIVEAIELHLGSPAASVLSRLGAVDRPSAAGRGPP